jgi:hypothetical protein
VNDTRQVTSNLTLVALSLLLSIRDTLIQPPHSPPSQAPADADCAGVDAYAEKQGGREKDGVGSEGRCQALTSP